MVVGLGTDGDLKSLLHDLLEALNVFEAVSGDESIVNVNPDVDSTCGLNDLEEETEIRDTAAETVF